MKKYMNCFLLFVGALFLCITTGYMLMGRRPVKENGIPNATVETETVMEDNMVVNQQHVEPRVEETVVNQYYLVSEDGFLLVFCQDKSTICLYTHMPISEFPPMEQDRLREGIWFPTMLDIFNYLESYSS